MIDRIFEYCSWLENDVSSNIIDFVSKNRFRKVSKDEVDFFLRNNRIDYYSLPQYLKDEIDRLDVVL